jgi:hypothetical protein
MVVSVPAATTVGPGAPVAPSTSALTAALRSLHRALEAPHEGALARGGWRWSVRRSMATVRDALVAEVERFDDGWLAARSGGILRERAALTARLAALGDRVLDNADVETVRGELHRLVADITHHVQRLHDLAYDAVELELGGSE